MKIIHVSDVHASRERVNEIQTVFDCITKTVKEHNVDLVLFAGDFWDATITNTRASGFTTYVDMVNKLRALCQVMFIYGTPKHEPKGALDVFSAIDCLVIEKPQRLTLELPSGKLDILAIPEPRKSDYAGHSAEEIKRSVFESYLNLANNRKKDNPFIVTFHGEVSGATYQNGIEAKSSIKFPVTLLQQMNADYYAFGHIHLPQEVFPNAFYPGSPAPLDFGESHIGVIHLVTLGENTTVTKIETNAPVFHTIELDSSEVSKFNPSKFKGNHLRLIVNNGLTKDNPHEIATELKSKSDLISCKVIVNRDNDNIVRSAEIAKRKTAVEKYEEYCKITKHKINNHALDLIRSIEESQNLFTTHPSKSFELQSISLRGAIGIKCGSGKDEIYIDFTDYSQGVVAMVGDNGRGKTTIIENCHPYPRMLTRKDILKKHFFLKDSHRILVYKDNDGLMHKIVITIDGQSKSGGVTYLAYTSKDGEKWATCIDTDGSLEAYNNYLNKTFGSIELFIRTSFFTKKETKGTPDLTNATKSEKIEFFSNLAGNEWLAEISDIAKEHVSDTKKELEKLKIIIDESKSNEKQLKEYKEEVESMQEEISELQEEATELKKELKELKEHENTRNKQILLQQNSIDLRQQISNNITNLEKSRGSVEEQAVMYEMIVKHKTHLDRLEQVKGIYPSIDTRYHKAKAIQVETMEKIDKLKDGLAFETSNMNSLQMSVQSLENEIERHQSQSVECDSSCPLCGSILSPEKAKHIRSISDNHKEQVLFYTQNLEKAKISLSTCQNSVERMTGQLEELTQIKDTNAIELEEAEKDKTNIDDEISSIESIIQSDTGLSPYTLFSNKNMVFDVDSVSKIDNEIKQLKEKLAEIKDIQIIESKEKLLQSTQVEYDDIKSEIASLKGEIKATKNMIAKLETALQEVDSLKVKAKEYKNKLEAYTHVQSSFSKTGIPLMELESAIPDIARMANDILSQSYGDRFVISFETIRQGSQKAVDDLNIVVYDSLQGMSKYIDMVCSGEEVWIKQALFYAFSIVRMNRTGFSFMTRFIDESDSSLDTSSRVKYLNMIEEAHKLAGAKLSVLITHSQEIKDVAEQVIEV